MSKAFLLTALLTVCSVFGFGQDKGKRAEAEIVSILGKLAEANLRSDDSVADRYYDDRMLMTSQSGKVYEKKDALLDVKNAFEKYENSDFRFLHVDSKTVIVNYQNTRKRKSLEEAKYRVTAVWVRRNGLWRLASLQSSKIATQGM